VRIVLSLLLRAVLVLAGLVFAASLVLVFVLLLALWSVRALWGRLTGRPVSPFVVRFGPRQGFEDMMRRARAPASRTPRVDAARGRARDGDVSDVEPRRP
jgi:NADH:ubiquinone oxidoreductase subunit H